MKGAKLWKQYQVEELGGVIKNTKERKKRKRKDKKTITEHSSVVLYVAEINVTTNNLTKTYLI